VDFFSIGTNDLTQYALAIDRGHPTLSGLADALHPGVLRLMAMTVSAARAHGKWVGVCGALASDPVAVPLLVGMGITELSASVPAVAAVKAAVRRCEWSQCAKLAERALAADTAAQVREMCMVQG
jgi:phosphocarrier protein FPr